MRDTAVQQMRVVAMLVIVYYHCLCYYGIWNENFPEAVKFRSIEYWRALCNLALNVFVYISGLLYAKMYLTKEKYRDRKALFRDKLNRLFIPYCIWALIALLIFPSGHTVVDYVCGAQHLWFLMMLMLIFAIIIPFSSIILNVNILIAGIIFFIFLNVIVVNFGNDSHNIMAWKSAVKYMPAFVFGILSVRLNLVERISRWSKSVRIVIFSITLSLVIFMGYAPSLPYGLIYINIPTYCFCICLNVLLSRYPVRFAQRWFYSLDKHSMGIYIIHHLLIWGILIYIPGSTELMNYYPEFTPILLFGIVFFTSWWIAYLINTHSFLSMLFDMSRLAQIKD